MSYEPTYSVTEVLRLKSEGRSLSQIATMFGISGSRVGQIIQHERQRVLSVERAVTISREISAGNDIDRKLPLPDLFCVLNLPKRPQTVLMTHFTDQGITDVSLREVMDFLIPIIGDSKDLYEHMPAYRVKMLGQINYAAMIKALSAVDCGEAFRTEWNARKEMLRAYLVKSKGFYPCVLHGKDAALAVQPPRRNVTCGQHRTGRAPKSASSALLA